MLYAEALMGAVGLVLFLIVLAVMSMWTRPAESD
jgi:hypothetical protein